MYLQGGLSARRSVPVSASTAKNDNDELAQLEMSIPKLNGRKYNDTLFEFKNQYSAQSRGELEQDVAAAYYKPRVTQFNRPSIGRQMRDLVTMPQTS